MTDKTGKIAAKPHYHGHRERMRDKFLSRGKEAFEKYEILEFFLANSDPRRDMKPVAKALMNKFKTITQVIRADVTKLKEVDGIGDAIAVNIKVLEALIDISLREEMYQKPVITDMSRAAAYCMGAFGHSQVEQFILICLDGNGKVIEDEVVQKGAVDHAVICSKEVVKRISALGASSVILAHNHPSGWIEPSQDDIKLTRELAKMLRPIGVEIFDHMIFSDSRFCSLKNRGATW
ncbi:MAG: DNA repair protein RadC [Alphaproteobacteria bacterium]|nr:DNA repair protein RadC [Alphaproteobacteria bacterium]